MGKSARSRVKGSLWQSAFDRGELPFLQIEADLDTALLSRLRERVLLCAIPKKLDGSCAEMQVGAGTSPRERASDRCCADAS